MFRFSWALGALFVLAASTSQAQTNMDWVVTKTEWSQTDEIGFGKFVALIAKTKCSTIDECLRAPTNPYRDSDPKDYQFWSDCADLPYFLRAYYAWKNQLPFTYVNSVTSNDRFKRDWNPFNDDEEGETEYEYKRVYVDRPWWQGGPRWETQAIPKKKGADIRYSKEGNTPNGRKRIAPATSETGKVNFVSQTDDMQNSVSSATFRFAPDMRADVDTDFYPIDITPEAVRPGAVVYSPMGHVSIVYEVTSDGRILLFNAHPADISKPGSGTPVSRTTFETRKEYVRSRPSHGSGLKQWRPFKLVNAKMKNGRYYGGNFVFAQDEQLPMYSAVQFFGTNDSTRDYTKATFQIRGKTVPYETFIRLRLASTKIDPLKDFQGHLTDACELFRGRVSSVQSAVDGGLTSKRHPETLPMNIFSADGDWENYSSPSRDARLRIIFSNIRVDLLEQVAAIKAGDPSVMRRPSLRAELISAYNDTARSCPITYKNSAGKPVTLSFDQLVGRLTKISFDPYHCPELRWGASDAAELATCRDDSNKKAWYEAEQWIRNYLEKDWKASGPIDITDLQQGRLDFGKPKKPDLDAKSFVERLPESL